MSEIPRPMSVEPVIRTVHHRKHIRPVEYSDADSALIKRRVEVRNSLRSLLERILGLGKMKPIDIWEEEWERIDEKALELVIKGVVTDYEEAKRIATDERFRINRMHVDFDERAKKVGNEVFSSIIDNEVRKSFRCYEEERSKPDLMDVGRDFMDRESVRAVKKAVVQLLEDGSYGEACEAFYEWLSLFRLTMADLESVPVAIEQIQFFKKALLLDLSTALEVHPHIFLMKKEEVMKAGFLNEGEIRFSADIKLAVRSELAKALARNSEYFDALRYYYEEEGLIGAYVNVEPDNEEHERSAVSVTAHFSAVWEEFLKENPYFAREYKKGFELNSKR